MNHVDPNARADVERAEQDIRTRPATSWAAFAAFVAVWFPAQLVLARLGVPRWAAIGVALTAGGLALWPMGLAQRFVASPLGSGIASLARRRGWAEWTPARWSLLWFAGGAWLAGLLVVMDRVFDALRLP